MYVDPNGQAKMKWWEILLIILTFGLILLTGCGGGYREEKNDTVVKYDVPLYNQGNTPLCWAYCQVMAESWKSGNKLTKKEADAKAIELSMEKHGKITGGHASCTEHGIYITTIDELYTYLVDYGPLYGRYVNEKGEGHAVVITGVNLTQGIVLTNNPWGVSGAQTFEQFQNGVATKFWQSNDGLKFDFICLFW